MFSILLLLCSVIQAQQYTPSLANLTYQILYPFFGGGGGRRERVDPLEAFGGISKIPIGDNTFYPSELVDGGNVTWVTLTSDSNGVVNLSSCTEKVDYSLLESSLGSGVGGYQGWGYARFNVEQTGTYYFRSNLLAYIDGVEYKADNYNVQYWISPITFSNIGLHTILLKLGGNSFWARFVSRPAQPQFADDEARELIYLLQSSANGAIYLPNVVSGVLGSNYFSLAVGNAGSDRATGGTITVESATFQGNPVSLTIPNAYFPAIAPGQIFPIWGEFNLQGTVACTSSDAGINVQIRVDASVGGLYTKTRMVFTIRCRTFPTEWYNFTYLDFDNSVQYAGVLPPLNPCNAIPTDTPTQLTSCPIMIATHGAGVDGAGDAWITSYQSQQYAYILFPSGRAAYGWDWEGPARINALTTISSFATNLPGVPASLVDKYRANPNRILFSGHSMGGHGCLILSTNFVDQMVMGACAAAWIKGSQYGVMTFINYATSFADPILRAIFESSTTENDPDLFAVHLKRVPFVGRTGSQDDNVIPWNIRRFVRVINQESSNPNAALLSEIPGEGHWFGGVVDDAYLQSLYDRYLYVSLKPSLAPQYTVRSISLWGTGRGGVKILQQHSPYTLATIDLTYQDTGTNWILQTTNVRRFSVSDLPEVRVPPIIPYSSSVLIIDNIRFILDGQQPGGTLQFCALDTPRQWSRCDEDTTWTLTERSEITRGPLKSIIEVGSLSIIYGTKDGNGTTRALQAIAYANALMYQVRMGISIFADTDPTIPESSALLLLGGPSVNYYTQTIANNLTFIVSKAIALSSTSSSFSVGDTSYSGTQNGLAAYGAIRGNPGRIRVLIAGTDLSGEADAWNLIPVLSGTQTPDWVVTGPTFDWRGVGGVLAAGYWGYDWSFRPDLSYPRIGLGVSTSPSQSESSDSGVSTVIFAISLGLVLFLGCILGGFLTRSMGPKPSMTSKDPPHSYVVLDAQKIED